MSSSSGSMASTSFGFLFLRSVLVCGLGLLTSIASWSPACEAHRELHRHVASPSPLISVYRTARSTPDRLTRVDDLKFSVNPNPVGQRVVIDSHQVYQQILGFGGAITEASTETLALMKPELVEQVLQAYYSDAGHKYSLGRVHINSCDFSLNSWSFDDIPNDYSLSHFDYNVSHAQRTIIPIVKRILGIVAKRKQVGIKIFASPWSPPAWMKSNGAMTGSNSPGLIDDPQVHHAWAKYLSLWVTAYQNQGIPIWGMTVQNEPEYAAPWEACVYTAEQQRDFIRDYLGPVMSKSHPQLKLITFDHNKDHIVNWTDVVYADADASQYIWGTGFHWYSGDSFDHVLDTHTHHPQKHLFATEACNCPGVQLDDWGRAEAYAHDIIGDLNNWAEGWTDWNIVLNQNGGPNHLGNNCDAPVIANTATQTLHYQPSYYYLGHFSRFLPPGSIRVKHDVNGPAEVITFVVPSTTSHHSSSFSHTSGNHMIVIAINRDVAPHSFELYPTPNSNVSVTVELLANSIVTLRYEAQ